MKIKNLRTALTSLLLATPFLFNGCEKQVVQVPRVIEGNYKKQADMRGNGRQDVVFSDSTGVYYQTRLDDRSLSQPSLVYKLEKRVEVLLQDELGDSLPDIRLITFRDRYGIGTLIFENVGKGEFKEPISRDQLITGQY